MTGRLGCARCRLVMNTPAPDAQRCPRCGTPLVRLPSAAPAAPPSALAGATPSRAQLRTACARLLDADPLANPLTELNLERGALLGEGGMGAVYAVEDRRLERPAALKLLHGGRASQEAEQRFLREAQITARLDHPSIPPVYEAGRGGSGHLYILMRRIDGETLGARLKAHHEQGRPSAERRELLGALVKVGEALAYAHSEGVIHRDVKPANIMIGAFGEVLLMDWGIARDQTDSEADDARWRASLREDEGEPRAGDEGLTAAGQALGTPGYMPPEQIDGLAIDGRADVFALGVTLARLLTPEPAIAGANAHERILATIRGDIRSPRSLDPSLPRELCWIVERALAPEPRERCGSASELVDALKACLADRPVPGYPYGPVEAALRAARRHPTRLFALLLGLSLLGLGALVREARDELSRRGAELEIAEGSEREAQREVGALAKAITTAKRSESAAQEGLRRSKLSAKLMTRAADLLRRGAAAEQLAEAIEKALTLSERAYPQLLTAARLYSEAKDPSRARALLEEATRGEARGYEALYALHIIELGAESFHATGAMRRLLKRARRYGDENAFTLLAAGNEAALGGDDAKAIELYSKIVRLSTGFTMAYNNRGLMFRRQGRTRRALADFERAVASDARSVSALSNRGNAKVLLGDLDGALEDFDRAIALSPKSPQLYLNRANARERLGQDKAALIDYQTAIELDGESPKAFTNLGGFYAKRGALGRALEAFDTALALRPGEPQILAARAQARRQKGDQKGALADLDAALEEPSSDPRIYTNRGAVRQATGDLEGALTDFEAALRLAPRDVKALENRGYIKKLLDQPEAAIADFDRAIELGLNTPQIYRRRAIARRATGQLGGARADLDRAIKLDPKDSQAHNNRANIRFLQGDLEGALEDYDRAIALDPKNLQALLNRGSLRGARGQARAAKDDYDRAIVLAPTQPQAYFERARARRASGELAGALEDYQRAIALGLESSEAYLERSVVRAELGDRAGAIADCDAVLRRDPKKVQALYNRSCYRAQSDDIDGALADLDRVLALDKKHVHAYCNRAFYRSLRGQRAAAVADYTEAIACDPKLAMAHHCRGFLHAEGGDHDKALRDYDQAILLAPQHARVYRDRGFSQLAKGAKDRARADLARFLELAPKDPAAAEARAKLEELGGRKPSAEPPKSGAPR